MKKILLLACSLWLGGCMPQAGAQEPIPEVPPAYVSVYLMTPIIVWGHPWRVHAGWYYDPWYYSPYWYYDPWYYGWYYDPWYYYPRYYTCCSTTVYRYNYTYTNQSQYRFKNRTHVAPSTPMRTRMQPQNRTTMETRSQVNTSNRRNEPRPRLERRAPERTQQEVRRPPAQSRQSEVRRPPAQTRQSPPQQSRQSPPSRSQGRRRQ